MEKWTEWYLELEALSEDKQKDLEGEFRDNLEEILALIALFYLSMGNKPNLPMAQVVGYNNQQRKAVNIIDNLFQQYQKFYNLYGFSIYMRGYENSLKLLEGQASMLSTSPVHINNVIGADWVGDGLTVYDRIKIHQNDFKGKFLKTLDDSIISGKSTAETINALVDDFNKAFSRARTLLNTEMNYLANKALFDAMTDNNVKQFQFNAILDNRTSKICRSMDKKIFLTSEGRVGENIPPLHPNCRSHIQPYKK